MNDLEAVREGDWKLHVRKNGEEVSLLYNLREDMGESKNLYAQYPEMVGRLEALLDPCREDLGDAALGIEGKGRRPIGRVSNPKPLTEYDENHPYIVAMYDSADAG